MAILCRFEVRYDRVQDTDVSQIGDARGSTSVYIINPEAPFEPHKTTRKLDAQSGDWKEIRVIAMMSFDYALKAILGFGGTIEKNRYDIRFLSVSEIITEKTAMFTFFVEAQG